MAMTNGMAIAIVFTMVVAMTIGLGHGTVNSDGDYYVDSDGDG